MALLVAAMALYAGGWSLGRDEPTRSGGLETAIDPVDEWQLPGTSGGAELEWSYDGSRLLVLERTEGQVIHVLDRDLRDQGALAFPQMLWTPIGATWSYSNRWIMVWGTSRFDVPVLLTWNASMLEEEPDSITGPQLGLSSISAAALMANDRILVVGGRDENGTSRLRVYELHPFRLHRDHAYPGNATVLGIRGVVSDMVCIDSSGGVTIYESREWMQDWSGRVMQGTPTAWCVDAAHLSLFGDGEGHLRYLAEHARYVAHNGTADGPVRGAAFTFDEAQTHVVAVGEPGGPSELQVWHVGSPDKVRPFTDLGFPANGSVTWVAGHPAYPGHVVVALQDGTVRSYQVEVTYTPIPDTGPRYPWLWLLWFPFGALVLAAAAIWWRDRHAASAARPEPERLRPRLSRRR